MVTGYAYRVWVDRGEIHGSRVPEVVQAYAAGHPRHRDELLPLLPEETWVGRLRTLPQLVLVMLADDGLPIALPDIDWRFRVTRLRGHEQAGQACFYYAAWGGLAVTYRCRVRHPRSDAVTVDYGLAFTGVDPGQVPRSRLVGSLARLRSSLSPYGVCVYGPHHRTRALRTSGPGDRVAAPLPRAEAWR